MAIEREVTVIRITLTSIALILATVTQSAAQGTTPPPQRDATGIAIIGQSLAAMGVSASATTGTNAQGTITYADGTTKPLTTKTLGLTSVRTDVGVSDFSFVANAGSGFLLLNGRKGQLRSWITAYKRPDHLPALSLMTEYLNTSLQVKYIGLETLNGSSAHHLRLSMLPPNAALSAQAEDLISEFHVWIDAISYLVVKARTFNFSPEAFENRSPVDTFYGDYRLQDGGLVPFHLIRYVDNQKDSDIVFTSISLNATVLISDFQ